MQLAPHAAVFRLIVNTVVVDLPDPDKDHNPEVASHLLALFVRYRKESGK